MTQINFYIVYIVNELVKFKKNKKIKNDEIFWFLNQRQFQNELRKTGRKENPMKPVDLEEFCGKILNLDKKIRFVGIVIRSNSISKTRDGLESLLSPSETEESIDDSLARWETRKRFSQKLGKPLYALSEYEKVKRLTIPIPDDGLILVSMDTEGFHEVILKEICAFTDTIDWTVSK